MSVRTAMLLAAVMSHQVYATDVSGDEFLRHVVALFTDVQVSCYGTLIAPNWVLTAANCFAATTLQYGNLSIPFNETTSTREVLSMERPRSSKMVEPDLGMIFINSVPQFYFAQLSAVDYRAITGYVTKYTDFAASHEDVLKEGVVSSCVDSTKTHTPHLCVAPRCSDKPQLSLPGEPGSPLYLDGKLVGVHVGVNPLQDIEDNKLYFLRTYTPISPYLAWVNEVLNAKESPPFL